jgi:hypothetical protein
VSLDALGDAVATTRMSGAFFQVDGGFVGGYAPPGEVVGLRFTGPGTLFWNADGSVGTYSLYRDVLVELPGLEYGECSQHGLGVQTTNDLESPLPGEGFFYLVTARNRLGEEGTKGSNSFHVERANPAPCP